jgi:hypothetical protein
MSRTGITGNLYARKAIQRALARRTMPDELRPLVARAYKIIRERCARQEALRAAGQYGFARQEAQKTRELTELTLAVASIDRHGTGTVSPEALAALMRVMPHPGEHRPRPGRDHSVRSADRTPPGRAT